MKKFIKAIIPTVLLTLAVSCASETPSVETSSDETTVVEDREETDDETETDSDSAASEEGEWGEAGELEAQDINMTADQILLDNLFIYNHVNGEGTETDRVGYVLFEYEMLGYVKYQVAYLACT